MILFVDDMPERYAKFLATVKPETALHVQTSEEAMSALLRISGITEVWLDHDAGAEIWDDRGFSMQTFRPVAYMLAAMRFPGVIHLHSGNPAGREWMFDLLSDYGLNVRDECLGFCAPGQSVWD